MVVVSVRGVAWSRLWLWRGLQPPSTLVAAVVRRIPPHTTAGLVVVVTAANFSIRSSYLGSGKSPTVTAETPQDRQEHKLVGRDFLSLNHFSSEDIKQFLWTAKDLKTRSIDNDGNFEPLRGKSAALVFQKPSTRTRLSAELGFAKLGGHVSFLASDDIHLGVNESVKDSARVLASMSDIILARVHSQDILDDLANEANVPVVNGSSDLHHPLQILADFITLQEHFGYLHGLKIAWVGGRHSVLHSLMYGCAKFGIDLNIATPPGHEPDPVMTAEAMTLTAKTGASFLFGNDPVQAVYRADVIVTQPWVSPGQEETQKRLQDFAGYQINRKMLKEAGGNWVFLHGLPRRKEEVTDDIFYGEESLVWQQAGNLKWAAMAVMLHLLQPYKPTIAIPKYVRG